MHMMFQAQLVQKILNDIYYTVCNLSKKSYSYYCRSQIEAIGTVLPIKAPKNMEVLFKNIDMITFLASVTYYAVFNTFFWFL